MMMTVNISYWGVILIVLLLCGMLGLFAVTDRRMLMRILRVLSYYLGSMLLLGAYAWGLVRYGHLWLALLGALFVTAAATGVSLHRSRLAVKRFFVPMFVAQLLGMGIVIICIRLLMGSLPVSATIAIVGIAVGEMIVSGGSAMKTYVGSLQHTQEHYLYLLSNGAKHLEAIMPSLRRCLRASVIPLLQRLTSPLVIAPPVLFCSFLLAGMAPLSAIVLTILLTLCLMSACFFVTVLMLLLVDHILFDRSGRLRLPFF